MTSSIFLGMQGESDGAKGIFLLPPQRKEHLNLFLGE